MKIVTENLGKRFNREWVFRNLNYQFNSGNIYVITGPNGSGKSTLMQVLWGQMQPSAGSVNYSDIDSTDVFKSVAIATPYMDLIEEFTLTEMIRFHFKFKKCRGPINQVIEKAELESSRSKPISTFSSGMKQRLKLALAFYSDCELLFLDEPCTNLDKKSIEWYHSNLKQVPSESMIFIASNQEIEYPSAASKIDILSFK
jgi:ABC-type multidrug transport system ATPase subunit